MSGAARLLILGVILLGYIYLLAMVATLGVIHTVERRFNHHIKEARKTYGQREEA
jgi:hypothetical protein